MVYTKTLPVRADSFFRAVLRYFAGKIIREIIMAQLLTDAEIQEQAKLLEGWRVEGKELQQTFKFKDFVQAIAFINKIVEPAEAAGHHPDLAISYNKVNVTLTTHDAGGLTSNDFELAQVISKIN